MSPALRVDTRAEHAVDHIDAFDAEHRRGSDTIGELNDLIVQLLEAGVEDVLARRHADQDGFKTVHARRAWAGA